MSVWTKMPKLGKENELLFLELGIMLKKPKSVIIVLKIRHFSIIYNLSTISYIDSKASFSNSGHQK